MHIYCYTTKNMHCTKIPGTDIFPKTIPPDNSPSGQLPPGQLSLPTRTIPPPYRSKSNLKITCIQYMHAHMHTYKYLCIHICIHIPVDACTHVQYVHTIHTCINTYIYIHAYTYIHTYIHTYI